MHCYSTTAKNAGTKLQQPEDNFGNSASGLASAA